MTCSTKTACEILDKLLDQIEEYLMMQDHEDGLEIIVNSILDTKAENITHQKFNHIITSMYQKLAIQDRKTEYAPDRAFREIAWLLESYYKGDETVGYDGAFYDAVSQGREGLIVVLARIREIILSVSRKRFVTFVISSNVDPSNWHLRKAIVKEAIG
jgi:hypothetical protein